MITNLFVEQVILCYKESKKKIAAFSAKAVSDFLEEKAYKAYIL